MRHFVPFALLVTACCGGQPPPADAPTPGPVPQPNSEASGTQNPQPPSTAAPTTPAPTPTLPVPLAGECKLPAPLLSDDSCKTDADCGVSAPCHAPACVAKDKSQPPTSTTVCTMSLGCHTADANRCGCHQGRCALIPPE